MCPYISFLGLNIGTYGICMTIGICLTFILAVKRGRKFGLIVEDMLIVSAFALGFAMFGGSLLYVLVTYTPAQILQFIRNGDFMFLGSGIVFYGGLIGGVIGALVGVRVAGCSLALIERAVVPFVPLGHAIGRIGCVMAGCCHGFAYDGPLAIHYPCSVLGLSPNQGYFPVQLLEAFINLVLCSFLLWYEKKTKKATDLLLAYLGLYAVSRFVLEMFRGDAVRGIWNSLSTSQIISILLFIASIIGMLWRKNSKTQSL